MQALLVDKKNAAKLLSICVRTLDSLTACGELSPVRIGRGVRFRISDLERFCGRREHRTTNGNRIVAKGDGK